MILAVSTVTCCGADDGITKKVPPELVVILNEMNLKIDMLQTTNMENIQDLEIENQELKNSIKALQNENKDICSRIESLENSQDLNMSTGSEYLQNIPDIYSNTNMINQSQDIQNGNETYHEQSAHLDKRILLSDPGTESIEN